MQKLDISEAKLDKTLGYLYLMCKGHPLASGVGRIYLHRYLVSIREGRWLERDEHVDHIDGDKLNNKAENLQILTPSQHAKKSMKDRYGELETEKQKVCCVCGENYSSSNKESCYCSHLCQAKAVTKFNISKEELEYWIFKEPSSHLAKRFGVSDVLIARYCKRYGIKKPGRGYWAKQRSKIK